MISFLSPRLLACNPFHQINIKDEKNLTITNAIAYLVDKTLNQAARVCVAQPLSHAFSVIKKPIRVGLLTGFVGCYLGVFNANKILKFAKEMLSSPAWSSISSIAHLCFLQGVVSVDQQGFHLFSVKNLKMSVTLGASIGAVSSIIHLTKIVALKLIGDRPKEGVEDFGPLESSKFLRSADTLRKYVWKMIPSAKVSSPEIKAILFALSESLKFEIQNFTIKKIMLAAGFSVVGVYSLKIQLLMIISNFILFRNSEINRIKSDELISNLRAISKKILTPAGFQENSADNELLSIKNALLDGSNLFEALERFNESFPSNLPSNLDSFDFLHIGSAKMSNEQISSLDSLEKDALIDLLSRSFTALEDIAPKTSKLISSIDSDFGNNPGLDLLRPLFEETHQHVIHRLLDVTSALFRKKCRDVIVNGGILDVEFLRESTTGDLLENMSTIEMTEELNKIDQKLELVRNEEFIEMINTIRTNYPSWVPHPNILAQVDELSLLENKLSGAREALILKRTEVISSIIQAMEEKGEPNFDLEDWVELNKSYVEELLYKKYVFDGLYYKELSRLRSMRSSVRKLLRFLSKTDSSSSENLILCREQSFLSELEQKLSDEYQILLKTNYEASEAEEESLRLKYEGFMNLYKELSEVLADLLNKGADSAADDSELDFQRKLLKTRRGLLAAAISCESFCSDNVYKLTVLKEYFKASESSMFDRLSERIALWNEMKEHSLIQEKAALNDVKKELLKKKSTNSLKGAS